LAADVWADSWELNHIASQEVTLSVGLSKRVLDTVAANPGLTADDVAGRVDASDELVTDALTRAVDNGTVILVGDRHWIVRTGKYGFHEYDHPIP
jgi:hypothetical protein